MAEMAEMTGTTKWLRVRVAKMAALARVSLRWLPRWLRSHLGLVWCRVEV